MRRSKIWLLTAFIVLLTVCFSLSASAQEITKGDLTYVVLDDGTLKVTAYNGTDETYELPGEIDGKPVSTIGKYCFKYEENLKKLTIPGSVSAIEAWGIHSCYELTALTVKEGNLKSVENLAFHSCSKLKTVNLPASVKKVGTMMGCNGVEEINISDDNPSLKSVDGIVFSKDMKTLIKYPQGKVTEYYVVPSSVEKIADNAFYDVQSNAGTIFIPKAVKQIGDHAFAYSYSDIHIEASSAPESWKNALAGRTVYYGINHSGDSTPDVVNFSAKQTVTTVTLSWDKVNGAKGYRIYKYNSKKEKYERVKTITSGTTLKYTVKDLKSATTYKFKIKAYKEVNGKTVWGDSTDALIITTKPAVTSKITAKQTSSSITLSWKKVRGATGYRVYRYNGPTDEWVKFKTTSSTSYTNKKLDSGVAYKYKVRAYIKVDGKTIWGNSSDAISVITKPGVTDKITAKQTTTSIKLSWKAVYGATGYRVYRYDSSTDKYEHIKTVSKPAYTVKGLEPGKTYRFKVRAYIKSGSKTLYGALSDRLVTVTKPLKAEGLKLSAKSKRFTATWSGPDDASGYQLIYSSTKKFMSTKSFYITEKKKTVKSLKSGETYYVKVRAYKTVDKTKIFGEYSDIKKVKIK